ncbi:MAG: alpha/beta hydrolase [Actinomycetota bacterium]|nr:alpha/beta hydrolase [Actinomycetota bacterium]
MSRSGQLGPERSVLLSAGEVRYRERGEGRPIVFVHGFLTNADLWRNVVPKLASKYRCIAPDWPLGSHTVAMEPDADLTPHGIARLIAEFLEALDLDRVTLVGNDTGGALAQMVATRHPERLGALVLTPCDAFSNFPAWWSKPLRPIGRFPRLMRVVGTPLRLRAVQRLPLVYGWVVKRHPPPDIAAGWVEPGLRDAGVRRDFGKAFGATRPSQTIEAARRLPEFRKPALVVWSTERSRIYPTVHGERLAALLGAPLVLVDDSYIYVPEDQPWRLAELLDEFLADAVPYAHAG